MTCGFLYSQDIIIDNTTDCYYIVDVDDDINCDAGASGQMDSPPGTTQTYDMMSMVGFTGPSDIGNIAIEDLGGTTEQIKFGPCGSASSPHQFVTNPLCSLTTVYATWWVCNGGDDFCIDIHY